MGVLLLCCTGCDRVRGYLHNTTAQETEQSAEGKSGEQLEFTHAYYCSPDSTVITEVDLPILNGSALGDSIFTYLENEFPGLTDAYIERDTDMEKGFQRMGHNLYKNVTAQVAEMRASYGDEDMPESMLAWTFEKHVTIAYDTPRYITYVDRTAEYTGGAHGMSYVYGKTFDKQTGEPVDETILKDADDPAFRALFIGELQKYFNGEDAGEDGSLEGYLLIDINALRLGNISLTDNSIIVRYQPYEIAAYAAGLPEAELTFEQVKPFLSQKGLALIGE